MRVNARTGRDLYEGTREPAVQEAVAEYLSPGMVFYDLGANVGLFTLIAARAVGPSGRVIAFEPDPKVCQRLRENLLRNELSQAQVVEAAAWSTSGTTEFVRANPDVSPDMGFGRIGTDVARCEIITVRSLALDDFVQAAPAPDMIKCDVEGAEIEVLHGARSLLEQRRPIIVCETHSGERRERVLELLKEFGYAASALDGEHVLGLPSDKDLQ